MTISLLYCLLLSYPPEAIAQDFQITGKIVDPNTRSGIANASIYLDGRGIGCISDQNGEFRLETDTLPVNVIVSHISYKTRRIWLENVPAGFTIPLEPSVKVLKEIEIYDIYKPIPFFKDSKYAVLDFEVDNDLIYLLIYRFSLTRSELLCKSFYGDTLASPLPLHFKPSGLFRDCLGVVHVLSTDSIYQVYLGNDSLELIHRFGVEQFRAGLANCMASTDSALFIRTENMNHQEVGFCRIDRFSSKRSFLASIADDQKIRMLRHNPVDRYFANMDTIPGNFDEMVAWVWVNKILYTPNESSLKKIGDTLLIFSTVDGSFELYTLEGDFLDRRQLSLDKSGHHFWSKEVYIDAASGLVYTTFERNGLVQVFEVDLSTGMLNSALTTTHTFPQKLKIHNGHLFYLYDIPGEGDNKHLYKQKL